MIKVTIKGKNPFILTPKVFKKMLHIPFSDKSLKRVEEDAFLSSQVGSSNILREFLLLYGNRLTNLSTTDINLLQDP
jgi:hypothetical protein